MNRSAYRCLRRVWCWRGARTRRLHGVTVAPAVSHLGYWFWRHRPFPVMYVAVSTRRRRLHRTMKQSRGSSLHWVWPFPLIVSACTLDLYSEPDVVVEAGVSTGSNDEHSCDGGP